MLARRLFLLFVLLSGGALSAQGLRMNAAIPEETQRIASGIYNTVTLANTLPDSQYRLEAKVEAHLIALPDINAAIQAIRNRFPAPAAGAPPPPPECGLLAAAVTSLRGAANERLVPSLRDTVLARRRAAVNAGGCPVEVEIADLVVSRTTQTFDTHLPIEAGSFATVTAFRIAADGTSTQVARKVFDAGQLGAISSHMVLGGLANKDQQWFSKQGATEGEFVVTREVDRRNYDPLAALLLSFQPAQDTSGWTQIFAFKRGAISGSLAVGLGTDADQPIYMAGYVLNITPAIGFAIGGAGLNQKRLKGIYQGDGSDKLTENLTPDQLMEDTFSTGFWFGITLRP